MKKNKTFPFFSFVVIILFCFVWFSLIDKTAASEAIDQNFDQYLVPATQIADQSSLMVKSSTFLNHKRVEESVDADQSMLSQGGSLICNGPLVDFTDGLPGGWNAVNNNPASITVWTNIAGCGEAGNWATGNGDAACASSDKQGHDGLYDTELRTPPIDLTEPLTATLKYWVNYQNYNNDDFLELDISSDGGNNWTTLLSWNEDHPPSETGFRIAPGQFAEVNLDAYTGEIIMLRWHYFDPVGPVGLFDWYAQVDDVQIACSVPTINVTPDYLESFQGTDSQVTQTLTIENVGGGILNWMIDEAVGASVPDAAVNTSHDEASSSWTPPDGFDMSIFQQSAPDDYFKREAPAVAPGNMVLFEQLDDPGNGTGAVSNYSTVDMLGIFSADDFVLTHTAKIKLIFADGYDDSNDLSNAPAIDWYIYPDSGSGTPAGYPGDGSGIALWHYTSAPGNPEVDVTNNTITLDLAMANEAFELPPGTYWLVIYPSYNAPDVYFDHWFWFDAVPAATNTADAMLIDPDDYLGVGLTTWTPLPVLNPNVDSVTFRVEGDYVNLSCPSLSDLPWLSVSPTSGAIVGGNSTAVDVVFDSTGLSTGVYTGTLCVTSDDTVSPKIQVPITLTVVIPSYGLMVGADSNLAGDPGTTVAHTIPVTNTGNVVDIFDISVTGATWATMPDATTVQILPGASADVTVSVDVPLGALAGEMDTAVFTAVSQGSGGTLMDTATLTTTADAVYSVIVDPDAAATVQPGSTITYTLMVTNTSNSTETFDLSVNGAIWPTNLSTSSVMLAVGEADVVVVTVDVPADAAGNQTDTAVITATSVSDGTVSDSATLATTAVVVYGVMIGPDSALGGMPGSTVTYTLMVTNTGNVTDTIDLIHAGEVWTTTLSISSAMLTAGESTTVEVAVDIPADAIFGEMDTAVITATSTTETTATDSATVTTMAGIIYGVSVSPDEAMSGLPGETVTYTVFVTNEGNAVDTFDLVAQGNSWTTVVTPTAVTVNVGQSQSVAVAVNIPANAFGGEMDAVLVTATSQGDNGVSDDTTLTTTALTVYAVEAGQDESAKALPGTTITYSVPVTNVGTVTDTFTLTAVGAWATNVVPTSVVLLPQETAVMLVSVAVPADAEFGEMDTAVFTATSIIDTIASDSVNLSTIAGANYYVELTAPEPAQSGAPTTVVTYTLWLTNTGNLSDTYELTASGEWTATVSAPTVMLASGVGAQLTVAVEIPAGAADSESDVTVVTAVSNNSSATAALTTTAEVEGNFIYLPFVARTE